MLFAVHCTDKPGCAQIRADNRADHLAYAKEQSTLIVLGGPMLSDDGSGMIGSFFLIEAPDRATVDVFCAGDPYAKAGLFESVLIHPYKALLGPAAAAVTGQSSS